MIRYLIIIPARGGSKGIPKKNIASLKGKPLISWTIDAALELFPSEDVFVSTDSTEIEDIASEAGASVIRRGDKCSSDTDSSASVVFDAFDRLKETSGIDIKKKYQVLILLQPTSPFRSSSCLKRALKTYRNDSLSKSLMSVTKEDPKCLKYLVNDQNEYIRGIHNDTALFLPRQKLPAVYAPNGAIFMVEIESFINKKSFLVSPCQKFIMCKDASLDIDTEKDLKYANSILKLPICMDNHSE